VNINQGTSFPTTKTSSLGYVYDSIIEKTSNPQHGYLLSGMKIIDISKNGIKDGDIGVLVTHLQYQ
jgi:hypothetical protein